MDIKINTSSMQTILITGINGFLGSHLAKTLSSSYNIIGIARNREVKHKNFNFKVYTSNEIEQIFNDQNIFAVIHTATVYARGEVSNENLLNTNLVMPVKLYEYCNKHMVTLFINTDTFFNDIRYSSSYLPAYTLSKKHVLEWLKLNVGNCKLVNVKLFHLYGPGDSIEKFIPSILSKLKEGKEEIDLTLGEQTRDFIYVDDVVNAYKLLIENNGSLNQVSEFELGTGIETSVKEFLLIAKETCLSACKLNFGALPYRENEIMQSKADNTPLLELGWTPQYTLSQGIGIICQ